MNVEAEERHHEVDQPELQPDDLESAEDQQLSACCKDDEIEDEGVEEGEMWGEDGEEEGERDDLSCRTRPSGLCQVCGDKAGGRYFNAIVCIPCKAFYLRMALYVNGQMEACEHGGHCDITPTSRSCRSCRYQRCLVVGMCRRERPMPVISADGRRACLVCGDTANGLHFGVQTCEGCKKFFRRAVREGGRYSCKAAGVCDINMRTRNACRYCRYRKCLDIGMSLKAVHIGRPTRLASSAGAPENKHSYPRGAPGRPYLSRHILPKFRSSITAGSRQGQQDQGQGQGVVRGAVDFGVLGDSVMRLAAFAPPPSATASSEWLQLAAAARGLDDVRMLANGWPIGGFLSTAKSNNGDHGAGFDHHRQQQQQQMLTAAVLQCHAAHAQFATISGSGSPTDHVTSGRHYHHQQPPPPPPPLQHLEHNTMHSQQYRCVGSGSTGSGSLSSGSFSSGSGAASVSSDSSSSRSNSFSSCASTGESDLLGFSCDMSPLDLAGRDRQNNSSNLPSTAKYIVMTDDDCAATLAAQHDCESDDEISSTELRLPDETDACQIVNLIRLSALEYEKYRIQVEKLNLDTKIYYNQLCSKLGDENRHKATSLMGDVVRRYIKTSCRYIASLPAFDKLLPEDQLILMKYGEGPAVIVLSSVQWYQADTHSFSNDFYCNAPSVDRPDYESYMKWLNFAAKLGRLQLDVYEASLFTAIVVLATDISELVDVARVEQARQLMLVALKAYVIAKHGADSHLMAAMFCLMPDLKDVADERLKQSLLFLSPDADCCHNNEDCVAPVTS